MPPREEQLGVTESLAGHFTEGVPELPVDAPREFKGALISLPSPERERHRGRGGEPPQDLVRVSRLNSDQRCDGVYGGE